MHPVVYFFLLIPTFFFLGKSTDILLENLAHLGNRLRLNKFIIGFVVLGFATSSPELFVAVSSSLEDIPQLSLGNLLGGIVVLFSLVIGLQAMFRGKIYSNEFFLKRDVLHFLRLLPVKLPFRREFLVHDLILMAVIIFTPLFLLFDQRLSQTDGLILMLAYLFYLVHALHTKKIAGWEIPKDHVPWRRIVILLAGGLIGLLVFSRLTVWLSLQIIQSLDILPIIFGLLILAIGTNLPEISIAIKSRKTHGDLGVGNVFGSVMANIFIIGVLGFLKPFSLMNWLPTLTTAIFLIIVTILLMIFTKSRDKLERHEGIILVSIYLVYLFLIILFEK